ncbi:MAG: 2-phosphosulfolactate phosphatase [bacterium]|nr:2-phosphosulfolactate phosphatase [bacterium]
MDLDVCLIPQEITEERINNKTVVVIDVLRASTTILQAIENGCRSIIPTSSVSDAMEIAKQFDRDSILLCGEREGKKIIGFDLGNSPFEYTSDKVFGKTLIYTSTNGSKTILKFHNVKNVIISTFNNLEATASYVASLSNHILITCSGKLERFSLEDAVCAGYLVNVLKEKYHFHLGTDGAVAVSQMANQFVDTYQLLMNCSHGRFLMNIGMGYDLEICSKLNISKIVPEFIDGKIIKKVEVQT